MQKIQISGIIKLWLIDFCDIKFSFQSFFLGFIAESLT